MRMWYSTCRLLMRRSWTRRHLSSKRTFESMHLSSSCFAYLQVRSCQSCLHSQPVHAPLKHYKVLVTREVTKTCLTGTRPTALMVKGQFLTF